MEVDFIRRLLGCGDSASSAARSTRPEFSRINLRPDVNMRFRTLNTVSSNLCHVMNINICDWSFLQSVGAIILLPFLPFVGKCCPPRNMPNWPRFLETVAFVLGVTKVIRFVITVDVQPKWTTVRTNGLFALGYGLVAIGLFLIVTCACRFGVYDTFVALEYKDDPPPPGKKKCKDKKKKKHQRSSKDPQFPLDPKATCYIPVKYKDMFLMLKFGTQLVYGGYSLAYACPAGIVLTLLQLYANHIYCIKGF